MARLRDFNLPQPGCGQVWPAQNGEPDAVGSLHSLPDLYPEVQGPFGGGFEKPKLDVAISMADGVGEVGRRVEDGVASSRT